MLGDWLTRWWKGLQPEPEVSAPVINTRKFLALHKEVAVNVDRITTTTEQNVLEIGRLMEAMLNESRQCQEQFASVALGLDTTRDETLMESLDELARIRHAFQSSVEATTQQLAQDLSRAVKICENLLRLNDSVSHLIADARILILNIRVEITALGEPGREVSSVADELAELVRKMADVQIRVDTIGRQTLEVLHRIRRSAQGLSYLVEDACRRMEAETLLTQQAAQALGTHLRGEVEMSKKNVEQLHRQFDRSLSLLQFQDPMVQLLQRLDTIIAESRTRLSALEGSNQTIQPLRYHMINLGDAKAGGSSVQADGSPEAGEPLFF